MDAGVSIVSIREPGADDSSAVGKLTTGMIDVFNQFYSDTVAKNVRRGVRYNAERGLYNGHHAFGYVVDASTKKCIPDPDKAPVVKRILYDYANGETMAEIARELNAQGLRTTKGKEFYSNGLRFFLKNRCYIGECKEGESIIPDGMPRLIVDETFAKVIAGCST